MAFFTYKSQIVLDFYISNLEISSPQMMVYVVCSNETKKRSETFINRWRSQNLSMVEPILLPNNYSDIEHIPNVSSLINYNQFYENYDTYPTYEDWHVHFLLISKFLNAIQHFLFETQANYIARITDDVFINFPALPEFFIELDTLKAQRDRHILVQAHCLDYFTILQGGSGFVLSREAAKVLYDTRDEFIRSVNIFEDWVLSYHIFKIHPDIAKTRSSRFIGHGFRFLHIPYQNHDYCPRYLVNSTCGRSFSPIKKVVFFHQIKNKIPINFWEESLRLLPYDLMWYEKGDWIQLCFMR